MTRISVLLAAAVLTTGLAQAQTAPTTPQAPAGQTQAQGQSGEGNCPARDTVAEAATAPQPGADSTDANNSGNTGWSGGTGGSHLGTNTQGAVASSPTWQPPTARGLDLMGRAEPVAMTVPDC